MWQKSQVNESNGVSAALFALGHFPTSERAPAMSESGQSTKSLRSSPLRGGKSGEAGSQLRGQRWRV
jgi:hypothetical protein